MQFRMVKISDLKNKKNEAFLQDYDDDDDDEYVYDSEDDDEEEDDDETDEDTDSEEDDDDIDDIELLNLLQEAAILGRTFRVITN